MRRTLITCLVGLILAGGIALGEPVSLRYRLAPGETTAFRWQCIGEGNVSMGQAAAMPVQVAASADCTQAVRAVDPSGNLTIAFTIANPQLALTFAGQALPAPPMGSQEVQLTVDPLGRPLETGTQARGGWSDLIDPSQLSAAALVSLPEQPVEVGTSWTYPPTPPTAGPSYIATSTVLAFVDVGGEQTAQIRTDFSAPLSMTLPLFGMRAVGTMQGQMVTWVGVTKGDLYGAVGQVTVQVSAQPSSQTSGTGQPTQPQLGALDASSLLGNLGSLLGGLQLGDLGNLDNLLGSLLGETSGEGLGLGDLLGGLGEGEGGGASGGLDLGSLLGGLGSLAGGGLPSVQMNLTLRVQLARVPPGGVAQ